MKIDTIYRGDCRDVLSQAYSEIDRYFALKGYGLPKEFADLIYMDPPFFSNKVYETFWPDDKEVRQFRDNWGYTLDDLKNNYLPYMEERIWSCYNVLKKTGSFYLHCDWHAGHYLKTLCDKIFGYDNFRNELVWCYRGAATASNSYPRKHDTILYYTKTKDFTFNVVYDPHTDAQLSRYNIIKEGKHYANMKGKIRELGPGVRLMDWWEIPQLPNNAKERLGYPTQKPELLLDHIISASSNPEEIVLDPFCGCGTSIAVAHKLGRHFVGIDISNKACKVMRSRFFDNFNLKVPIIDSVVSEQDLKKLDAWAFQQYTIEIGHHGQCKSSRTNDKGIDGFTHDRIPIQVKQSDVGRPIVDSFETALNRFYAENNDKPKIGIIVGYYFTDEAWKERKRAKIEHGLDIQFETIVELLNSVNRRYDTMEEMDGTYQEKIE